MTADPDAARAAIAAAVADGRSWLDPAEVEAVLDAYRIPRPAVAARRRPR